MDRAGSLEKLDRPPIVEVVCGVLFDAMAELDPVVMGAYWAERREEYPGHKILPPISRAPGLMVGKGPIPQRTWFVNRDESFILQFQPDAFYLNWRAKGDSYPRFSSSSGVLARALEEHQLFSDFCRTTLGHELIPNAVELAKIDHFVGGRDFTSKSDLMDMLPCLKSPLSVTATEHPQLDLRFQETRDDHFLQVSLTTVQPPKEHGGVLQLETVVRHPESTVGGLHDAFVEANREANAVFEAWVPEPQRKERFMGGDQ